jgi:hypothetical protein
MCESYRTGSEAAIGRRSVSLLRYDPHMALGDMLNWAGCPPAIRRQVRNYVLGAIAVSAAAVVLIVVRDPLGIPREPWGRYGPLALGLIPICVLWPMFLFSRRRVRRQFDEAGGRLCTHCAYNLATMGDRGTCPECGEQFNACTDAAMWTAAGFRHLE